MRTLLQLRMSGVTTLHLAESMEQVEETARAPAAGLAHTFMGNYPAFLVD
jgi:hypothetical protein